jgi:hypothetical protein
MADQKLPPLGRRDLLIKPFLIMAVVLALFAGFMGWLLAYIPY